MGILSDDMKRIVREQRLGYIATVCPDGTPNLSPKGTTAVWDDDHLVFADVKLPQECLPSRARITYCQPLKGDEFAMGLQFSLLVYDWIGSP